MPDQPLSAIAGFEEQAGQGLAAKAAGTEVRLGSAAWVGATAEADANETRVVADNVYHFSPACDAILDAKRFAHDSMLIVKGAFVLSFLYNVVGLSFAVSGLLTLLIAAVLMPLSSATVVGFITLAVNGRGKAMFSEK